MIYMILAALFAFGVGFCIFAQTVGNDKYYWRFMGVLCLWNVVFFTLKAFEKGPH